MDNKTTEQMSIIAITGILLILSVIILLWLPFIIIFNLPLIIVGYLLIRYTFLKTYAHSVYMTIYQYLFYRSEKPRKLLWSLFYNITMIVQPQSNWKCMNYGYAVLNEDGKLIENLKQEDEEERFPIQLYHYMATNFCTQKNLENKVILEVGCGRGGGSNYISQYLKPKKSFGVDFSDQQVIFCKNTYQSNPKITFFQGDAENLDQILELQDQNIDIILNVESSHCYGNFEKFATQIGKLLKKGGHFMYTDFMRPAIIPEREADLIKAGFKILKKEDITINVLQSLKLDDKRKISFIEKNVFFALRPLAKKFGGLLGSNIHKEFQTKMITYVAYVLVKE